MAKAKTRSRSKKQPTKAVAVAPLEIVSYVRNGIRYTTSAAAIQSFYSARR